MDPEVIFVTTQQLGYFLKLAEELNYTKVAQAFFITQPTLSKQIVNLENELKVTLFDRDRNSVKLTKAGQRFYNRVKPVFQSLMDVIKETQSYEDDRANLVIGIQEEQLVSNSFVLAITKMRHLYPDLKMSIQRGGMEELIEGLREGKYDLINVFSFPNTFVDERTVFEPLETEAAYLAYSPKLMQLEAEITKQQVTEIFSRYDLILPVMMDAVDDEKARQMIRQQMKDIDPDKIRIRVIQTGRPISLPVQVASQIGVSLSNETNIFSIDPEIHLAKILDTEGSYVKGLMHRRIPDNPYVKIAVDLAMEEQRKAVNAGIQ